MEPARPVWDAPPTCRCLQEPSAGTRVSWGREADSLGPHWRGQAGLQDSLVPDRLLLEWSAWGSWRGDSGAEGECCSSLHLETVTSGGGAGAPESTAHICPVGFSHHLPSPLCDVTPSRGTTNPRDIIHPT